ncbi:outer membrane beta-barrel protein [Urechidicola vernalis]|uniref:Outer membrane beta-barrel protein n=1 Tax=Urechidicola vernalis TaxID=3075600 RepID=A0ABU2Y742_9FLAO|nr:outer membrane beta-barrel protein [Urechidicola sp. P050]MDT0553454.1 outer membrane beta-barrel protein [Urechidicola sp. P050]
MKKKVLLLCFVLFGITMHSQVLISLLLGDKLNSDGLEFGLEGGFNFSSISGLETKQMTSDLNLGFYFDIRVKNNWYLDTGVLVKSQIGVEDLSTNDLNFIGATIHEDLEGQYDQVVRGFLVPAQMKYEFEDHIYVEGGLQFGLVTKAYVEFNGIQDELEVRIQEDNRDAMNRIDVGAIAGFGYQLKKGEGMTIGAKYSYGFVNAYKEKDGTKHNSIFVKVNIPIGKNKGKEKRAEKERLEKEEEKNLKEKNEKDSI